METLKLLGGVLAPYCNMLEFTTRRMEMQRLVNEIITPIAAQLAQQKHSQLARLGCTVEEAPPGTLPTDGKGISVAVGSHGRNSSSSAAATAVGPAAAAAAAADAYAKGKRDAARLLSSVGLGNDGQSGAAMQAPAQPGSISTILPRKGKGCASKAVTSHTATAGGGKCSSAKGASSDCGQVCDGAIAHTRLGKAKGGAGHNISHKRFESGELWQPHEQ